MSGYEIVKAALDAVTFEDAQKVQSMIARAIGAEYWRPLGDKPNNGGLLKGAGGSYDHKLIENVTNMQDAVLERAAGERFARSSIPFSSPHEAASGLFSEADRRELANRLTVTFRESDPPAKRTKRMTVVFRDQGCGMTAAQVPDTIFALGAEHKEGIPWLQGAFGVGGAMTYRNARAVVVITRRAPELLLDGEADQIVIAVVEWQRHLKNDGAFYLVTTPWKPRGDAALPFSIPASEFPDFGPGTHVALISYGVEGYHRARQGDERSFDIVADTRLFDPVLPYRFNDEIHEKTDSRILSGLGSKLERNPRPERREGVDLLPFRIGAVTYQLPMHFWFFAKKGEPGGRQNFVARDHGLLLTSNGQVHKHWSPQEFKLRTGLAHLADRLLVVVQTDALPIEVRSSLFTADRSDTIRNEEAIRLEHAITGALKEWTELQTLNNDLIREAISGQDAHRSTRRIADQISRALRFPGFSADGRGTGAGGPGHPPKTPKRPVALYEDPTTLEGPEHVIAEAGKTKSVTFVLNAVDDFIPRRAELLVRCDHPEINGEDITVSALRGGHVRVLIAVPSDTELGVFTLRVAVPGWLKVSGGLGPELSWETKFEVVDKVDRRPPPGPGPEPGKRGPGQGHQIALVWRSHEQRPEWSAVTVGEIEYPRARDLAAEREEYADLAALGDQQIPTLVLNQDFAPLKSYLGGRVQDLGKERIDLMRDHYAVGVGVGILFLNQQDQRRIKQGGQPLDETAVDLARQALAHGMVSTLPRFDELARAIDPDPTPTE
jgi:hypothetical protein